MRREYWQDIAANLFVRPWELDRLTVHELLEACASMQYLRDEAAKAKAKS